MVKEYLRKIVEGQNLAFNEAYKLMEIMMSGKASSAQMAAILTALRMKGETVEEISAFALTMKRFCRIIKPNVKGRIIDVVGTGGDAIKTLNISTLTSLIVAGAGVPVAKHGNRSFTSKIGSADLLEHFGLNLNVEPEIVEKSIEENCIGFMFAPTFHPAMKHAVKPRKEIGIRTVFNLLGPLSNPANVKAQLLGVFDSVWLKPLALVLKNLGCEEVLVVHGTNGIDEISIVGETKMAWLRDGEIKLLSVFPKDFGFKHARIEEIVIQSPEDAVKKSFQILYCNPNLEDPQLNMVLMNSSAALVVGEKADDFRYGIELALESIRSGSAYKKLKDLIKAYNGDLSRLEEMEKKYG